MSLVNVWGTWCVECRHEHDFLLELALEPGMPIYGLNVRDDRRSGASNGSRRSAIRTSSSGFDPEGKAAIDWGVTGAPETFLIGSDGNHPAQAHLAVDAARMAARLPAADA